MKRILLTVIIGLCCFVGTDSLYAQDQQEATLRERIARRQAEQDRRSSASQQFTVRADIKNESEIQHIGNAPWVREIYRFLDLEKEKNAPLFYPVRPISDRMNFFSLIFKEVLNGNVDVYEYQLDGSERFTPEYKLKIDSAFFQKFDIPFEVQNGRYIVNQADVPNEEIRGYYIKEAWYFDKNNSTVDIKTIAVCPVMMYQEYDGSGLSRFPLFWLPYESIRPYAAKTPMIDSNLNNAWNKTINDFFLNHNFEGEIYKTTNMTNRTLAEQFEGDSLKKEQKKIELELKQFEDNLWVYNDSTEIKNRANAKTKTSKKGAKANTTTGSIESGDVPDRATIQKEVKQQRVAPSRSMRNRKRN